MSAAAGLLARRSNSTASLAQFYQEHNPNYEQVRGNGEAPELDFCNAFWGEGDAGFEVLMARMRASARTIDDLKGFMKERANIEEEYGKKLAKLAKQTLGKDETGELRAALEALRIETDKQAGGRLKLAGEIRKDVELPIQDMANKLGAMRKNYQSNIEKLHKNKVSQETLVAKAQERYEQDCLRINSYTANTSLVQGKDLEKLQSKLDKVQQTVGGNEREYKTSVKALEETTRKWEVEWKTFCDHVQDLEEERINFIKDNAWNLANAISSVCVTDDESCERIRVALEGFEDVTEIEAFVRGYGTGPKIPDPPLFIDYARGQAYRNDKTARVAKFQRATNRSGMSLPTSALMSSDKSVTVENVTPGEAERTVTMDRPISRATTTTVNPPAVPAQKPPTPSFDSAFVPGAVPNKSSNASDAPAPVALASPMAVPRPPSAFGRPPSVFENMPPAQTGPSAIKPSANMAEEDDPLARQLAELRRDPPAAGSIRRGNSVRRPGSVTGSVNSNHQYRSKSPGPVHPQSQPRQTPQESQPPPERQIPQQLARHRQSYQSHAGRASVDTSLVPPTPGHTAAELAQSKAEHDRRNSRQFPPMQDQGYNSTSDDFGNRPASRPGSVAGHAPRAPTPVFMQPPVIPAATVADQVLDQYHQALPGERSRSRAGTANSRPGSRMGGDSGDPEPVQPTGQAPRPNSVREGFVGIGAGGRSPSPQPGAYQSLTSPPVEQTRSTTPGGSWNATHRYSQSQGPGSQPGTLHRPQSQSTRYSIHGNPSQSSHAIQDQRQSTYGANQAQIPQAQPGSLSGQNGYGSAAANSRYGSVTSPGQSAIQQFTSPAPYGQPAPQVNPYSPAPVVQSPTGFPVPGQPPYQRPTSTQPGYPPVNSAQTAVYTVQQGQYRPSSTAPAPLAIPTQYQPSVSPAPVAVQSPHHQQPSHYYNAPPQQQAAYAPPSQYAGSNYGAPTHQRAVQEQPANIVCAASPQPPPVPTETPPTGQYSTTGQPVLFFKALYDYQAQSDSEFDFQEGDIIAVTATPPDGWWSGELLDEARRLPGRTDFPSNL
ncbi:formin-binding protein, variant 2 [Naganishia albida]|nr:formin-binding protein, variant 2 [Naganishia albida]